MQPVFILLLTSLNQHLYFFKEKHEEFSLAFAGTTVHDMFNWLKVLISIANIRFSLKR
ncbi:unnamed protein product, partial [Rotaria sordida]